MIGIEMVEDKESRTPLNKDTMGKFSMDLLNQV